MIHQVWPAAVTQLQFVRLSLPVSKLHGWSLRFHSSVLDDFSDFIGPIVTDYNLGLNVNPLKPMSDRTSSARGEHRTMFERTTRFGIIRISNIMEGSAFLGHSVWHSKKEGIRWCILGIQCSSERYIISRSKLLSKHYQNLKQKRTHYTPEN